MKTSLRTAAVALLLLSSALGAAGSLEPQDLKAHWTFAEGSGTTAADASGQNVHGTLMNGAAWTVGRIGTAVALDGTNDWISLGSNLSILQNVPGATLSTWVRLDSMPASGAFRELVSISVNSATSPTNVSRAALALRGDGTAADVFAGGRSTDTEAQQTLTADANLTAHTWHHVAARLDFAGDTIEIYVNGALAAQAAVNFSAASTSDTPSSNAALGAQDAGDSNYLHGALDETAVYGRLLSAAEIQTLANGQALRARWTFDEGAGGTTADATGNQYTGTLRNGVAWTTGQMGGGLLFDGVDDWVDLGASQNLARNVNATTVAAWIRPDSTLASGSFRELVSISVNSATSPTNTSRIALALRGDGSAGDLFVGGRTTEAEPQKNLTADVNLVPGAWAHVAAVLDFSGKRLTLYLNGNPVATGTADFLHNHTPNTASTNAALGAQDSGDSNFFHGAMDDVRLYGRALCPCEIETLALRDGLRARWPFDEGTGITAADASGNNVNGTLVNGAAWGVGQFGAALSLDGVDDHATLGTNLDILRKSNAATIATWVRMSSLPASGAFRELLSISVNSATPPTNMSRAALAVRGDGSAADLFAGGRSTDTEAQQTLTADANLAVDTWYHVAAVLDFGGNAIRIYVNGSLAASAPAAFSQPATPDTPSSNVTIGAQDSGDSNFFHGLLDEMRVYCRALSLAEIQDLALGAPPPAPTNLQATAGDTTVSLSWNAAPGASSYDVYRRVASGTYGPHIGNTASNSFTDVGLTNGVEYFYVVKAVNAAGESPASNEVSATPNATGQPPAKPVILTASQTTNDNTPSVVGTADPNVGVTVEFRQGATVVESIGTTADVLGNWSVTASAKADGTYTVVARASNAFGSSLDSDPITITIDTQPPSAPANFRGSAQTTTSILWEWDNVAGETGFEVRDAAQAVKGSVGADVLSFAEAGLSENTAYARHVNAIDVAGASPDSNAATTYTRVHDPLAGDFTLNVDSSTQIDVAVAGPPNGTAGLTGCQIERSPDGTTGWAVIKVWSSTYSFSDTGRTPGTTYHYRIQYRNGDGVVSALSPVKSATTPSPLAAPANFRGTAQSTTSILWQWDDVAGETGYELHDDAHASTGTSAADVLQILEAAGLTENSKITRHVHAVGAGGPSQASNTAAVYTRVHDPVAGDFTVVAVSTSRIDIVVTAPPNGSADFTACRIERSLDGVSGWVERKPFGVAGYSFADTGLAAGTTYHYRIRYRNGDQVPTADSPSKNAVTPLPPAPANFRGTALSTTSIEWAWDDVLDETGYDVHEDPHVSKGTVGAGVLVFTESTGLTENVKATRHVHALNGALAGDPSAPAAVYTRVHNPVAADFTLTVDSSSAITIAVVPPPNATADFTACRIERSPDGLGGWTERKAFAIAGYTFQDTGLAASTTYFYRFRYCNGDGIPTADSPVKSAVTEGSGGPAPLPPTNVRTIAYFNAVDVEWDRSPSTNVVGYNVYRRLSTDPWPPTPTPLNGGTLVVSLKYRDHSAQNGQNYVYRVTAVGN